MSTTATPRTIASPAYNLTMIGSGRASPNLGRSNVGIQRLAREQWGTGRSLREADLAGRNLVVDEVEVREGARPENAARVLALEEGERVWIRRRRFVLDGKPVLLSTS